MALPEILPAGPVELRRCRLEDLDALMAAIELSQHDLAQWLPWADPMPTPDAERDFLLARQAAFDAKESWGYFLRELGTGELVGGAGLHPKEPGVAEIGYWVRSDRTRRGYATAAAGALTAAAFEYLRDVKQVVIRMDQRNVASAAVPPKLGYRLAGKEPLRGPSLSGQTGNGWTWVRTRPG